jgi:thiamine kinase-like enzyme
MPATIDKVCRTKRAFINELYIYESAFPDKPKLIEIKKPRTLVLAEVDGIPYLDVPEITNEMIIKLAKTIGKLHSVARVDDKVLCHWDNQPRNILWDEKNQHFYLIDFEDIRFAPPEADITHLFLFWAEVMTTSEFTSCINLFIRNYKSSVALNQERWKIELKRAKSRFDRRRKKHNKKEPVGNTSKPANRRYLAQLSIL